MITSDWYANLRISLFAVIYSCEKDHESSGEDVVYFQNKDYPQSSSNLQKVEREIIPDQTWKKSIPIKVRAVSNT